MLFLPRELAAQWLLQTTLEGNPPITGVKAVNKNIGWLCTENGNVYRTTDGGENWDSVTPNPFPNELKVIDALDAEMAFVGDGGEGTSGGNAKIYRTIDGGATWDVVYTATGSHSFWNMLHFFDDLNGIAMSDPLEIGQSLVIIKTSNGGATWSLVSQPLVTNSNEFGYVNSFEFLDDSNGWFGTIDFNTNVNERNIRVFRTTDGGETWMGYPSGGLGWVSSVTFVSPTLGIRTSISPPHIARSTDGGQSWTPVMDLPVSGITSIHAGVSVSTKGGSQIWAHGEANESRDAFMLTSIDEGLTWTTQSLPNLGQGNLLRFMSAVVFGEAQDSIRIWAGSIDYSNCCPAGGGSILTYLGRLVVTDVRDESNESSLESYVLSQNYPNPFNPLTYIEFHLPKTEFVELVIFNLNGRPIRSLVSDVKQAGLHLIRWDGRDDSGQIMTSGTYFYQLKVSASVQTRKLVLLK